MERKIRWIVVSNDYHIMRRLGFFSNFLLSLTTVYPFLFCFSFCNKATTSSILLFVVYNFVFYIFFYVSGNLAQIVLMICWSTAYSLNISGLKRIIICNWYYTRKNRKRKMSKPRRTYWKWGRYDIIIRGDD